MKFSIWFLMVFMLCHVAYDACCQQIADIDIHLLTIPGLGIHISTHADGSRALRRGAINGKTLIAASVTDSLVPANAIIIDDDNFEGQSVSVSEFEDIPDPLIRKYAEMIHMDVHDINNYPLYKFIDAWYGVRYRWGGEDAKGIDCSALSRKLYNRVFGCDLRRTSKQQHKQCEKVKRIDDAEEGDLIFFRMSRMRITHVGIYLANGYFLHASKSKGVMISNLENKYWHRRYAGCGRIAREDKNIYESDAMQ